MLRHAGNTGVVMFVEEHSLRVLEAHLARRWRTHVYHLSEVAGKCTDQSAGSLATRVRKCTQADGGHFEQFA